MSSGCAEPLEQQPRAVPLDELLGLRPPARIIGCRRPPGGRVDPDAERRKVAGRDARQARAAPTCSPRTRRRRRSRRDPRSTRCSRSSRRRHAAIDGAACFMPRNAPTRFTSSTRLKPRARLVRRSRRAAGARVVDERRDRPEARLGRLHARPPRLPRRRRRGGPRRAARRARGQARPPRGRTSATPRAPRSSTNVRASWRPGRPRRR